MQFPSDPVAAAQLRIKVCKASRSEQRDLWAAFANDPVLWVNMTGWTVRTREVNAEGREVPVPQERATVPFTTWPEQSTALATAAECIRTGRKWVCNKSREQGATWLLLAALPLWGYLFHGWKSVLTSKEEKSVDLKGVSDSMFWKIDRLLEYQPDWVRGAPWEAFESGGNLRTHLVLRHPRTDAWIVGQAATESISIGGRPHFVGFDEAAHQKDFREAWQGAMQSAACCGAVSTHFGVGTYYEEIESKARAEGVYQHIELLYHQHPEQGKGKEWRIDQDGEMTGIKGTGYWWTPWLAIKARELERNRLMQDVFAQALGSGASVFPPLSVASHRDRNAREAEICMVADGQFVPSPAGKWLVWKRPEKNRIGGWAIGMDPSYGTGNHVSAAAILDTSGHWPELAAMMANPGITPADAATEISELTRKTYVNAVCAWERNGPGMSLARDFEAHRHHPKLWLARKEQALHDAPGIVYGWWSDERSKRTLIGELSRAVQQGEITIRCRTTLDEMLAYILDEAGRIVPGRLRNEPSGARENHGDRVIALALAYMAARDALPVESTHDEWAGFSPEDAALLRGDKPDPFAFGRNR